MSLPVRHIKIGPNKLKRLSAVCLAALFSMACGANVPFVSTATPVPLPTPIVVRVEIKGQTTTLYDDPPTATPIPLVTVTPFPTVAAPTRPPSAQTASPQPTDTPSGQLFPTATPTQSEMPSASPPMLPTTPIDVPSATPAESNASIYTGPLTGQIMLIDPDSGFNLPVGINHLEFKWLWTGAEVRPCQLQEGYGFQVRIWPNPASSEIANVTPKGTIDAVEEQDIIAGSCDPKTGTRRFTVQDLANTPGVKDGGGQGQFFGDVAYVHLEPYQVVSVSVPHDFFIPPPAPDSEPTATATSSPTPLYVPEPGPKPAGIITLLRPEFGHTFPPTVGQVEFKWHWSGLLPENSCQPAPGYGFEIRIGSLQPGFIPLGVMDVVKHQDKITCDREAGVFNYTLSDLKEAPGVKETFEGENKWDGKFQWDVALVSLNPYIPPDSASIPNAFEISLAGYPGPFDPFGAPLKCSDFSTWIEAQAVYLAAGGPVKDPHQLDDDGNGVACD